MRRVCSIAVMVGVLAACSSTVQQPDGSEAQFKWLQGELKTAVGHPLPAVHEAARSAFEELRFVGVDESMDRLEGRLRALMADGTPVRVRLEAAGTEHTFIYIKVGTIGDKPISLQILRHIQAALNG